MTILKTLIESWKGLEVWYSRGVMAVWERDVLGKCEAVGLRIGLGDTAGPPELCSQNESLWDLRREAKGSRTAIGCPQSQERRATLKKSV